MQTPGAVAGNKIKNLTAYIPTWGIKKVDINPVIIYKCPIEKVHCIPTIKLIIFTCIYELCLASGV